MPATFLGFSILGACASYVIAVNTTMLKIDASGAGLPFDGHGALSAGASSRLLYDYSEPYRSQVV